MTLKGLWYLAHPYSGDHLKNFKKVNIIAAKLIKQGIMIYSPISHTHPIAYDGKLDPDDHDLWLKLDRQFMEHCEGLILCDGWEFSFGCRFEYNYFKDRDKPIHYIEKLLR